MMRVALVIHRALLFAYPAAHRVRYADEMAEVFAHRLAAARATGPVRALALSAWLCLDVLVSGLIERARRAGMRWFWPRQTAESRLTSSRSWSMVWESLISDVRLALRQLRKAPFFAAATIATLGLGIGANSAIFSVVHAVLLRPLPYADPDRLVTVWSDNTRQGEARNPVSPANFDAFHRETRTLAGVEAMYSFLVNIQVEVNGSLEMVTATSVSPGMLDLIGRPAHIGRALRAGDDNGVLLSHAYWQRAFAGDRGVLGRTLPITGSAPGTILGVMPADFIFPYKSMLGPSGFTRAASPDMWMLLPMTSGRMVDAAGQPSRTIHYLSVVGRLRPDTDVSEARAELTQLAARRAADLPDTNAGWGVTVLPLHDQTVGSVRPAVLLLLGGVGVVLLMTCINIANVLLARAAGRGRDLAIRTALGAPRRRLVQQSLVESLVLALAGALIAIAIVVFGTQALVALAPSDLPRLDETRPDALVVLFTMALATLTGLAVGALPAVAAARARMGSGLSASTRTTASARQQRVRAGLVVAEIALATMLTIGTGLLLRSFIAVMNVDPGFEPSQLLTFQQNVPSRAASAAARVEFLDTYLTRLSAIPGVTRAGGSTRIPLGSTQVTTQLAVDGRAVPVAGLPEVDMRRAVGDYFAAMGIPVLQGRVFGPEDRAVADGLAVVNAALAARIFPGESALHRRVRMGPNPAAPWLTIIGVVGDIRHSSLEDAPRPEIYIAHFQGPPVSPFIVVRTNGDAAALAGAVRATAIELGADPPYNVRTMEELRGESLGTRRFVLLLAGLFGTLALVLAAVGVYGVIALIVSERTSEVGVRFALGATPADVLRMLLSQAIRLGATGIAIGAAAGFALARVAASLLFGIGPLDPVTFIGVPLLLLGVALIAALVPARRAMSISPTAALRTG